jgi:hypothetical protein
LRNTQVSALWPRGVGAAAAGWRDRVDVVSATCPGQPALLVRPDGFVAWAGPPSAGLSDALTRWLGAPKALTA